MTDKFGDFLNKWITPVTLTAIFGAIIWGVQLNIATLNTTKQVASLLVEYQTLEREITALDRSVSRIAIILDNLENRIARTEEVVEEHNKEAEEWKRRILLNEQHNND